MPGTVRALIVGFITITPSLAQLILKLRIGVLLAPVLVFGQVTLTPDRPVVRNPATGVSVVGATDGRALITGLGISGTVTLALPDRLPEGTSDTGVIRFPSQVSLQIRQSWNAGSTSVTLETTAIGRCSTNLDSRVCPINFMEIDSSGGTRRAYVDADIQLVAPGSSSFPTVRVRFHWVVNAPGSGPQCTVVEKDHIEIIQVTQTPDNKILMVADRATMARVFLKLKDPPKPAVAGVTGELHGLRNGSPLPGSPITPFNAPLSVPDAVDRERLDHSLNFDIPSGWTTAGPIELRAEIRIPACPGGGTRPMSVSDTVRNEFVAMRPGRPLNVAWVPVCHTSNNCPIESDVPDYDYLMREMYPLATRDLYYHRVPVPAPLIYTEDLNGPYDETRFNWFLAKYRLAMSAGTRPDHLVGVLPRVAGSSLAGQGDLPGPIQQLRQGGQSFLPRSDTLNDIHWNANTLAHELGHNLGRYHPGSVVGGKYCSGALKYASDVSLITDWPYETADIQEVGVAVTSRDVKPVIYADLMSYCAAEGVQEWVSPHTYTRLFETLRTVPSRRDLPNGEKHARTATAQRQILLSGSVGRNGSTANLNPAYQFISGDEPPLSKEDGTHCVQFFSSTEPLSRFCFTPEFRIPDTLLPVDIDFFAFMLPLPEGATRVALMEGETVLAQLTAASSPPQLAIQSPSIGEVWGIGRRTMSWSGTDPDGAELKYMVLYSSDGGQEWLPFALDYTGTQLDLDPSRMAGGKNVMLRVIASSGFSSTVADAGPIEVIQTPVLEVASAPLEFGNRGVGQMADHSLVVKNTGSGPLQITDLASTSAAFRVISPAVPLAIEAGAQRTVTIRWYVDVAGRADAVLRISSNDPVQPEISIPLLGSGVAGGATGPAITVSTTQVDFGSVSVGQSAERRITISNTGGAQLLVSTLRIDSAAFGVSPASIPPIDAGRSVELTLRFAPGSAGSANGTLSIGSNDATRATITVGLAGVGTTSAGGADLEKITPLTARGWPNERTFDNPPRNAVDGSTTTFTWTTNPNNTQAPSYFGVDLGAAKSVSRIRVFKDNDGGGGTRSDHFKNLTIEYTDSSPSAPLESRTWTRVTGMSNGFRGAELLSAAAVNADGTITRDSHNSLTSGWASLSFTPVNATGIRIGFSNVTDPSFFNHYKVHEFEAYGPRGGSSPVTPLRFDPLFVSFSAAEAGQTKALRTSNPNTATVTITRVTSSNPSFVNVTPLPLSIGAGSFDNLSIRFSPAGIGSQIAILTVETEPAAAGGQFSATGVSSGTGGGGATSNKVTATTAAGWPNGRASGNLPPAAIDGSTSTYTWTTESFNAVNPSYLGIGFGAPASVNRIRLFKDNNAGGPGLIAKHLTIEYTTSPSATPLSSRTWTPVSGLTNGYQGAELLTATSVNSNGTVTADNHDSLVSGWASLTFNAVEATGIRIGFTNATPVSVNHYRVYEFEAYSGSAGTARLAATSPTVAPGAQVSATWNGFGGELRDHWIGLFLNSGYTRTAAETNVPDGIYLRDDASSANRLSRYARSTALVTSSSARR